MAISDATYIALTTFRRNGVGVTTPVWVVPVSDGRIGFYTTMGSGKTKRIKVNPRVTVQPSSYKGDPKQGTVPLEGTAELLQEGPIYNEIQASIGHKYGVMVRIAKLVGSIPMKRKGLKYADSVVAIRLGQ